MSDPLLGFTHGDRLEAAELRRAFATIGEHHPDPHVARLARQVAEGGRTVREAIRDPAFQQSLSQGIGAFAQRWEEMSGEERREMIAAGTRARQDLAHELGEDPGPDDLDALERPPSDALRRAYDRLLDGRQGPQAP